MGHIYLFIAIVAEVIGTTTLKTSEQFTRIIPSIIVIVCYGTSFYCLSLVLKTIQLGVAYAIWSGAGIILIAILGMIYFKQIPDIPAVIGMLLIVAGVVTINLFSQTVGH
jgi:small multidrug resistance pump